MNNLATIQKVTNVRNHPNGDALDIVQVLGWEVVTKRGEYKENELVVYVVIDTVLSERPEFEFLRNKNFRIKPIRLRGEVSNGICFPLSILPVNTVYQHADGEADLTPRLGEDVTEVLGIKHYEKPISPELAGQAHGGMPSFLIITDEDNLRSYPDAVPEMFGRPYYITRKEDGSSGTFFLRNNEFGVTSRRIHLKDTEGNGFWRMARKYDIENAMRNAFPSMDIAIQGEVIGPSIQKNQLGVTEMEFRLFNLFDITSRTYLDYAKIVEFTSTYKIPMVPLVCEGTAFGYTLEELVKLANEQKYGTGGPAEGIVIRPKESFRSTVLKKAWSGKVLNENYKEA
jgi:RNA ligase (TIGR02306 family)